MNNNIDKVSGLRMWLMASRPKTLLAAVVPVLVGSALAMSRDSFFWPYSLVAFLCALLIQVGTNFTNDLYDFLKGADNDKRKGPQRVLASGLVTISQMKLAIGITFGTAFILGLYLVNAAGILILIIGIFSIAAGLAYTAGPFPLAYNGLGDIFVFIFFGVIGTMGTYFIHTNEISMLAFLASVPVGALITNILIVNNYRDINEDKEAGKNTLAVILGETFSKNEYIILLVISYCIPVIFYILFDFGFLILLPFLTLPLAVNIIRMLNHFKGSELNKTLELSAKFSALFGFLFALGIIL